MDDNARKENFNWYVENFAQLSQEYGNDYIVIKDKKIIGHSADFSKAFQDALKVNKMGSFIIQRCGANESAYTNHIASMLF